MFDFLESISLSDLLLAASLFCLAGVIFSGLIGYWMWRQLTRLTAPDIQRINTHYAKIQSKHPNLSEDKLIQRMIRRQAVNAGLVGAATSLGGFYTLPITLPIDMALSLQIQNNLVQFISQRYGQHYELKHDAQIEQQLRTYLVMSGGSQLSRTSTRWLMAFVIRLMEKSFAKLIPFMGAFIGFGVNYTIARATGQLAVQWYSGKAGNVAARFEK